MPNFPVDSKLPDVAEALRSNQIVILTAEPGAGKTTRVAPGLLGEPWLGRNSIVMLEPRRLAARRSAEFMAFLRGEKAGATVGYRIRGEHAVGPETRIEIVTEAILTRMIQDDPSLRSTGLLIFDEFHERSIHSDLGLALALDVRSSLRPDLRIVLMSATIDAAGLARQLGGCTVIESPGRQYPVETRYLDRPRNEPVEMVVASAVRRALKEEEGDILVFLPGQREIHRVRDLLKTGSLPGEVMISALYGEAPLGDQNEALAPPPAGLRKVILSTSIAETSLTIEGVRVVVDSGLSRTVRFDPRRGMSGLVTVPVPQTSADQRRGRAGRIAPGVCYRCWTEAGNHDLPARALPEILSADLAPLCLELAVWGSPLGEGLVFPDPPPKSGLLLGRELLLRLGALNADGACTPHGRAIAGLPLHPRLGHMVITAREENAGVTACDVAAILEARDIMRSDRSADVDLHSRWYALRSGSYPDGSAGHRVRTEAARLRSMTGVRGGTPDENALGWLLALAYPDRIARRREGGGERYQMSSGTGARLPAGSSLSRNEFIAIGEVDGTGAEVRIYLAEPVREKDLRRFFGDQLVTAEDVYWNEQRGMVVATRTLRLGAVELESSGFTPPPEQVVRAMLAGIRSIGLQSVSWSEKAASIRTRSEWVRRNGYAGDGWPDLTNEVLEKELESWLGPFLGGVTKRADLDRLDLLPALRSLFSHRQWGLLDRLAPEHWKTPAGSTIRIDYSRPESAPVIAVRLQEMFGQVDTPSLADGTVPVVLHLLSPARRPLAVTRDLKSFWTTTYPQIKNSMRADYPKHVWPDDPLAAAPTRHARRRK